MKRKYTSKERKSLLLEMLRNNNKILITDLVRIFEVSEVSIRKDLEDLEEKKLLLRVKGGAVNIHQLNDMDDLSIDRKQLKNAREKQLIGKYAASLIKENETIILDSGTTTLEIAKNLAKYNNLTIITNGLNIAMALAGYNRFSVIVLGGNMRSVSISTVGMLAESCLRNFYCDKLFLGVDSFNIERGISTPNIEEASLNQAMISAAKEVIAVFDSSKFEKRSFAFIASLDKINTIITDSGISEEIREHIERKGIKLHIVDIDNP
ncbi:MAG: DeoR/GlpR family DNA-binding transcription regulator [Bacteroidales bacterium]|nr:DeoR/GlpR family DNA-binding transcription regulator [Bacteroidales bacterium]